MESSWQNKCSSPWTTLPSSSQQQQQQQQHQQGARNQVEMSAGSFSHPYVTQEVSLMDSGVEREPMLFSNSNTGSCRSDKPNSVNSFPCFVAGYSSQLHHGIQQIPSSTSSLESSQLPLQHSNGFFSGDNYGAPVAPVGLVSSQLGNRNMSWAEHFLVPSRAASTSGGFFPDLHSTHQPANVSCNSEINQTGMHSIVRCNESGTDLSYLRQGWLSSLTFGQHNTTNVQASMKAPSVKISAAAVGPAPPFSKGNPRVFCLATNGELLLNSNGLLGVVCLCHGQQMSISKFCEHSGSCIVNPGHAVRLESGETVSQWRRLCFPKYGIRVPDDNSGWDWPETSPATVRSVNCKATVPNIAKNSEIFKVVDPFTALTNSGHQWNHLMSPNNSHIRESVMGNTSSDVVHNVQQRHAQEGYMHPTKNSSGAVRGILPAPSDIQTMHMVQGSPRASGSEKEQVDSGYQSFFDYISILTKDGDPLPANQSLGNFKFLGTGSDVSRGNDTSEASIIQRDVTSSNIELRLGQPSQQRYNLEGSVISPMLPQSIVACSRSKSFLHNPKFHNSEDFKADISVEIKDLRQKLQCVSSNVSNSQGQNEKTTDHGQFAPGDTAKVEQFKAGMSKSSHMLLSHSSTLFERDVMPRTSNNMINFSGSSMPSMLLGECHGTAGPNFPRNRSNGTHTQVNSNKNNPNHMHKGTSFQHIADQCSYATKKGNFLLQNDQMAGSSPFSRILNNNHLPCGTTMNWKQSSYFQDAPEDISNQSNPQRNSPFLQASDCFGHTPVGVTNSSTVSSVSGFPLFEVSSGFVSTNSLSRPSLMQLLSNKEHVDVSPCFLDENLRLLAPRHTLDSSKQKHAIASHETEREQERVYRPLTAEMQQRASAEGSFLQQRASAEGSIPSEELKDGSYLSIKNDTPESVKQRQTCSNHFVDGNFEKFAKGTGMKNWCNFSTSSHGISFLPQKCDMGHPSSHDHIKEKQVPPSIGRIGNNSTASTVNDASDKRRLKSSFTGNCSFAVHSNCFAGKCVSRNQPLDDARNAHFGRATGNTLKPVPSLFGIGHMAQEEKARYHSENLDRRISVRSDCHPSQWRDVPSKPIGIGNATRIEKSTKAFDSSNVEAQVVESAGKRFDGIQVADSLNERQMSNMCSGCSAPAVTEVTFEVNTAGSCTVDAENDRYVNENVVDEGSGIQRCCSSDEALDSERSNETINVSHKVNSIRGGKSSCFPSLSSHGHTDSLRLGSSFGPKNVQKRLPAGCAVHANTAISINEKQPSKCKLKTSKIKKTIKWKRLDGSFPVSGLSSVQHDSSQSIGDTRSHSCSSRSNQILSGNDHASMRTCDVDSNQTPGQKRKYSRLLSAKTLPKKRDLCELTNHEREGEDDSRKQLKADVDHLKIPKSSGDKKSRQSWNAEVSKQCLNPEIYKKNSGKAAKYGSTSCAKTSSHNQVDTTHKKTKPVVRGKAGIICSGKLGEDRRKPAKLVALSTILKTAKICSTKGKKEAGCLPKIDTRNSCSKRSTESSGKLSVLEGEGPDSEDCGNIMTSKVEAEASVFEAKEACGRDDDTHVAVLTTSGREDNNTSDRIFNHNTPYPCAPLKSRFKEARKRSLSELAGKGKDLCSSSCRPAKAPKRSLRSTVKSYGKPCLKKVDGGIECHECKLPQSGTKKFAKEQNSQTFTSDSSAFCSVCRSSRKDDENCLLECSSCLIRVHQACYGISRVPKGRWCCRPCRAECQDNACVLCGYGGGAMTRALKSRNIVKGLLKAWSIISESKSKQFSPLSETSKEELRLLDTLGSACEVDSNSVTKPVIEQPISAPLVMDSVDEIDAIQISNDIPCNLQVHNSITAGVADPAIKQWVHMVCGLWTPGTRCPNVDTMGAFDVSGVLCPYENVVCSICNRPGGSCIKCKIENCSVEYHPWCAHQKGLLQSEVEGIEDDRLGFYSRCELHATHCSSDLVAHPIDTVNENLEREEFTCARTEGYKGRKKDGFMHKHHAWSNVKGECLVPQEQINAWLHITGQKSCARWLSKPQTSATESDCRKEYARYKQAKGWKNLVVYKSGIHGLGLYTSQFIPRGAMVVEYVGEIVGQKVSDKREIEYQSGRKLQYKSACYFFKIDKEHIIDATRKGGIARFVNHSCMPNCVAKVISVRNEKKVVFFAERDINPGEEVTYDYHFNNEEEGEKIPCFCNSQNCRRFLN